MKTADWMKPKVITPGEAIKEFMRSYSSTMNSSLQIIVNVINQAKKDATPKSMDSCLQQAHETVDNMRAGLELMRKNILNRMRIK